MKTAYLDCSSGISGDMFIASFIDAGFDMRILKNELAKLGVNGYGLAIKNVTRQHTQAKQFLINIRAKKRRFSASEIRSLIKKSRLNETVKKNSLKVFEALFNAERIVHKGLGEVHLHELGDMDTVLDIVGACACLYHWKVEKLFFSNITFGQRYFKDGMLLPNPAPASIELLKGVTARFADIDSELITPTGAAIISVLGEHIEAPVMKVEKIGYGAGSKVISGLPNVLRLVYGSMENTDLEAAHHIRDSVAVLEASIDDTLPIVYTYVYKKLFSAGALDVYITPVLMKKNRPGHLLTVIAPAGRENNLAEIVLRETGTNGMRFSIQNRIKLEKRSRYVMTGYGKIKVKEAGCGKDIYKVSPEYESVAETAEKKKAAFMNIYEAAKRAALSAAVLFTAAASARADSVFLNQGAEEKGIVVEEYKDRIKLSTVDGEKNILKSDIKSIEYDLPEQNLVAMADKYMNAGNYETAYYYYEKAKTVNPQYKDAVNGVNYLNGYLFRKESKKKLDEVNWYQAVNDFEEGPGHAGADKTVTDIVSQVGIELAEKSGNVIVSKVYENTPAANAGLLEGDIIASIWGKLTGYMTKQDVEARLTEPENIEIKMQIDRAVKIDPRTLRPPEIALIFDGYSLKNIRENTEAYSKGLRDNDLLLSIDGKSTRYMPMDNVLKMLKGPVSQLLIRRDLTVWKEKEG